MKRMMMMTVAVSIAAMLGGCCTAQENQINTMRSKMDLLMNQANSSKNQIAELDRFNQTLTAESQAKDAQIGNLNLRVSELEEENTTLKSTGPVVTNKATGKTAIGWMEGTVGDKISVGSDVLFSSGRATLTTGGKGALRSVANAIKANYAGLPVRIYGFTDSDPIVKSKKLWSDNLDLSANRAMAVTRYLISQGISGERIETIAMGATRYVTSNASKTGKARNRRVEIMVVKQ
ncbi:MAG: OmpA family protein [Phycisphaerales bacterium]|jgi:chemotaxis protein MotB|nr:OmpA family protein [Phycisphaerales bacterium]MBT7170965.1 OmpA family protein [Phycisphaerales bacterium]